LNTIYSIMDIRQVKESKPKLGELAEARFRIIHNIRTIQQHESLTAAFLAKVGTAKILTKKHLFILSTSNGKTVDVTLSEPQPDGQPFLSFPEPVRLFCIEIGILHDNAQLFADKSEDEVMQIVTEILELAPKGELFVEQGKFVICIRLQQGKLWFLVPEMEAAQNRAATLIQPVNGSLPASQPLPGSPEEASADGTPPVSNGAPQPEKPLQQGPGVIQLVQGPGVIQFLENPLPAAGPVTSNSQTAPARSSEPAIVEPEPTHV